MRHICLISAMAMALFACLSSFVWETNTDATGTWEYKAHTEEGHTGTFVISNENGSLLGSLESLGNEYAMENLKLEGSKMSFDVTTVDGYLCLVKGNIDDETFSGTLTVDYDDMPFEAKRVDK